MPAHERPEKPVAADVGDARSREVKRPLRRRHEVDLSGDRAPPAPWAGDDDRRRPARRTRADAGERSQRQVAPAPAAHRCHRGPRERRDENRHGLGPDSEDQSARRARDGQQRRTLDRRHEREDGRHACGRPGDVRDPDRSAVQELRTRPDKCRSRRRNERGYSEPPRERPRRSQGPEGSEDPYNLECQEGIPDQETDGLCGADVGRVARRLRRVGGDVVLDHTAQGQDLVPFEGRGRAGQPQKRAVQHQRKHAEARRHPDPPRRHDRALRNGLPAQPGPHGRRLFTSSPFLILLAPEDSAARRCELAPLLSTIQRTSSSRVPETAPPPRCGARRRSSTPPGSSEPRNRRRRGALKGISGSIDRTRNNGNSASNAVRSCSNTIHGSASLAEDNG